MPERYHGPMNRLVDSERVPTKKNKIKPISPKRRHLKARPASPEKVSRRPEPSTPTQLKKKDKAEKVNRLKDTRESILLSSMMTCFVRFVLE